MFDNFERLAVDASECQRDRAGHKPNRAVGQGLLADILALKYDVCQYQ
jgi:hypothetical protein